VITRNLVDIIASDLKERKKIVLVYGARQVGKTTLIKALIKKLNLKTLSINADLTVYHTIFSSRDLKLMSDLIDDHRLLFIDEAQNIPDIGLNLKILYDEMPDLKIIVSGSSSFDLANELSEPLTGRTQTYHLHPLSLSEIRKEKSVFDIGQELENYLIYGLYPEVYSLGSKRAKISHLRELVSSYLYKDILQLSNIKHSDKLYKLLKLIAYQLGNEVSIQELAQQLSMSHDTVNSYIDLLEKSFVLMRLSGLSKNLRKEISKKDKIYFTDLGIRNTLIENYNSLENRTDVGPLWENFLFMERQKKKSYDPIYANQYFWRTYDGAEIDYVEERDGTFYGFEFKWSGRKRNAPKSWLEAYGGTWVEVNRENYLEFVL